MYSRSSTRAHRHPRKNVEVKSEDENDKSEDLYADSDFRARYTSTPSKKSIKLERTTSVPNVDSQESDEAGNAEEPVRRPKSGKSLKRERSLNSGARNADRNETRGTSKKARTKRVRTPHEKMQDAESVESPTNRRSKEEDEENEKPRRKKNRFRAQGTIELPITEILRRAQENQRNQMRHEEPIKIPDLSTDTMYVQGKNGFSAVKIPAFKEVKYENDVRWEPIQVAIKVHSLTKDFSCSCQGLLAGLALSQIILVNKILKDQDATMRIYTTNYPFVVSGLFSFLSTMCLLGAMDKVDISHLNFEHLRQIAGSHLSMILAVPLYLGTILIHLVTMNSDNKLASASSTEFPTFFEEFSYEREMYTWKYALAIVAWFCVTLGPNGDMMLIHLESMQKYMD